MYFLPTEHYPRNYNLSYVNQRLVVIKCKIMPCSKYSCLAQWHWTWMWQKLFPLASIRNLCSFSRYTCHQVVNYSISSMSLQTKFFWYKMMLGRIGSLMELSIYFGQRSLPSNHLPVSVHVVDTGNDFYWC